MDPSTLVYDRPVYPRFKSTFTDWSVGFGPRFLAMVLSLGGSPNYEIDCMRNLLIVIFFVFRMTQ